MVTGIGLWCGKNRPVVPRIDRRRQGARAFEPDLYLFVQRVTSSEAQESTMPVAATPVQP